MSKDGKRSTGLLNSPEVHPEPDDNVVKFPTSSASSCAGGEEDVGDESPTVFYFVPEWDTGEDDPPVG